MIEMHIFFNIWCHWITAFIQILSFFQTNSWLSISEVYFVGLLLIIHLFNWWSLNYSWETCFYIWIGIWWSESLVVLNTFFYSWRMFVKVFNFFLFIIILIVLLNLTILHELFFRWWLLILSPNLLLNWLELILVDSCTLRLKIISVHNVFIIIVIKFVRFSQLLLFFKIAVLINLILICLLLIRSIIFLAGDFPIFLYQVKLFLVS
jgi:hypothetical protein